MAGAVPLRLCVCVCLCAAAAVVGVVGGAGAPELKSLVILEGVKDKQESRTGGAAPSPAKPKVPPGNYSGPPQLHPLDGLCFELTENNYDYTFCPFQNVTQKEASSLWSSFSGILGTFVGWRVADNGTLTHMLFAHGTSCSSRERSARVKFMCGPRSRLTATSEPETCQYALTFETPYACVDGLFHERTALDGDFLAAYDELGDLLYNELLTPQGFKKRRLALLTEAGVLPATAGEGQEKEDKAQKATTKPKSCEDERSALQHQVAELRSIVDDLARQLKAATAASASALNCTAPNANASLPAVAAPHNASSDAHPAPAAGES